MAFNQVRQVHGNGCFVAAVAMLIGKDYHTTCKLLFPDYIEGASIQGLRSNHIGLAAATELRKLGCVVKPSRVRKLDVLRRIKKHALLILRWDQTGNGARYTESYPAMCHAVVYDGETDRFLDPNGYTVIQSDINYYQRTLDSVFYVEPPKVTQPNPIRVPEECHEERRDAQRDQRARHCSSRTSVASHQAGRIVAGDAAWG